MSFSFSAMMFIWLVSGDTSFTVNSPFCPFLSSERTIFLSSRFVIWVIPLFSMAVMALA
jgi:hypothetical protein